MDFSPLVPTVVVTISCFVLVVLIRLVLVYQQIQRTRQRQRQRNGGAIAVVTGHRTRPCKTLVVLGSGGHTSEMLHMVQQLLLRSESVACPNQNQPSKKYSPIHYVVAATDHTSVQRLEAILPQPKDGPSNNNNNARIHVIPRSREVGQSYASSMISTLYALMHSVVLVLRIRPELLLTNGPGTCVPIVLGCWILRLLGFPCTMVFCESYCRVQTLSLSGKLLYPLVDCFLVHWESLHDKYPQSYRLSTFVMKEKEPSPTLKAKHL